MIVPLFLASVASLNCEVEPPKLVLFKDGAVSTPQIGLPPEMNKWKFGLSIDDSRPAKVKLDWAGDPIRVGDPTNAIQVGPKDYSFFSVHSGPCLFTNTSCIFMFTVSLRDDQGADILVQPSAITEVADGRREPFQVFMKGRCTPVGAAK